MKFVSTTHQAINIQSLRERVLTPECGAVVTFEGVVRNQDENGEVSAITYEMYEAMAKKEMNAIADEALSRWPGARIALAHRSGKLAVGEVSVVVFASAPHRKEAFLAAQYAIDEVKKRAPIWKKEETKAGSFWKDAPNRVQPKP